MDLGNHVFKVEKYRMIYENLLRKGVKKENFLLPNPSSEDDLLLVHKSRYIQKLKTGKLSPSEILSMELPYTHELYKYARLFVGGTILAAENALEEGISVHIGGGFHHAYPDHGEGFCILNDIAIALEKLKRRNKIRRAMIVDCDVHQGNGTAFIFSSRDYVFTFSIHQMDLYPAKKEKSSLDLGLWSGDGDEIYNSLLRAHLPKLYEEFKPDLIFYLAGADPYERDCLGGLKLTIKGLKERDEIVIEEARKLNIPITILLAGGYAPDVAETVSIHLNTIQVAERIHKKYR